MLSSFNRALTVIFILAISHTALSESNPDDHQPNPGEIFSSYFARLTRGGTFPGIYLNPPKRVQDSFLHRIKLGTWVGEYNAVGRKLKAQGVDLWGHWYGEKTPQTLIFPTTESKEIFTSALKEVLLANSNQCEPDCPTLDSIMSTPWEGQTAFAHQTFSEALVLRARLFKGRTLIEFLADAYGLPAEEVISNIRFSFLDHVEFERAVRETGYTGPIYFRGITAPDPKFPQDTKKHLILLDDTMILSGSPFQYPLFRCLEIVGIFFHETSHVCQDLLGQKHGLDIQVRSAEDALVIEGMAEALTEKSMREAGQTLDYPSALSLFATTQGVEIIKRPGNETTGNLFPYTVGLPFIWSLYDLAGVPSENHQLTLNLLEILGAKKTLPEFLKHFGSPTVKTLDIRPRH